MKRRDLREHIFKLVFTVMESNCPPDESFLYYFEDNGIDESSAALIENVVKGVIDNLKQIDKVILDNIKGYKFERISKVCLSVMRVAVYEILFIEDIPENVSISEAIEIAEKYEDEKSKAFVNGVLGSAIRNRTEGE